MKFAFPVPHLMRLKAIAQPWEAAVTGPEQRRMMQCADRWGYDMIAVPEHLVIPVDQVELSGSHYLHSTTAQAFIAGATERVAINSCVTILPLQHPIVLAKALATADWMSGGRMMVTFGVGWLAREFELLGVPFGERGRIADEYLAAIVELWTSDTPRFDGRYVSFADIAFEPKPVQKPHLPVWIGGDADAALRRAARFGSGWWPFLTPPEQIAEKLDYIKSQPCYDGRPFEVMHGLGTNRVGEGHVARRDVRDRPGMSAGQIVDRLGWLAEQGVTVTAVPVPAVGGVDEYLDYAQWVIEEIKPQLA
ncbi:TIGR03619 family F420-dependent LLM class oxidoreductase [Mycobacterium avium]|uniref:TIGR03619 family F420-dependent LLM class oxidoreductase n=1 Tax=Mycobacterium avium TaxID=1764 RepID=UPI0003924C97|nr:TIGR03619 family F420-dependent LLM class oxidoreductase [Mycobacterium avium]ETA97027.1 luciferase [Mycobacterium avium 10-5581]APA76181.1 TIGR03619 family F420-dependent LLM class oxidoreductase [Mycobacterium avium subsp. hominissuis]ATO62946.1 TIGR03619 family F420-dependent LLM class oxidoreductase [Mycobacterium avium subsp. hominissuis]ATO67453.1 TIGR03619 family F420-dependent LLM class oxidoreductase [Mycobacterium avium subsp. hominissuis]ATO72380.1 TIGR03619 family F420-dependent